MTKERYLIILSGILALILEIAPVSFAGTVGNPGDINALRGRGVFSLKETRNVSLETSIDVDFVINRDLKAGDVTKAKLKTSNWSMVRVGYKVFDRVEPYVRLGWAHLKAEWREGTSETKVEMATNSDFAWGFGLKALIYEFKKPGIRIIGDGSYRTADLDSESGYLDEDKVNVAKTSSKFVIREWQASLLAATDIDLGAMFNQTEALKGYKLSPYGGIKYSEISGRIRMVTTGGSVFHPDNIKSDKNIGVVVGCDLIGDDNISVNLEGRFIDETAVSTGLALLF